MERARFIKALNETSMAKPCAIHGLVLRAGFVLRACRLAGLHYTCERYIEESENSLRIAGQSVAGERLHWFRV